MEHVTLGRGGPEVSAIGIGMWQAGGKGWGEDVRDEDCREAMERAVHLGVNLFDTAEVYGRGHSEEVVGQAIKAVGRERVFIATKVGGEHLRAKDVARACRGSLRRLRVDEIDLYQVHWPNPWDLVPLRETMKALEGLQKAGKIRHIGVSNFAVRDLEDARSHLSRTDIVSDQVQYSLLHREPEAELLPYCRREGVGLLAWSPLAKGILAGTYHAGNAPKDPVRSENSLFTPENLQTAEPLVRLLKKTGRAHRKTAAQAALAWLRSRRGVVPIPGVKRAAQAEEHVGALGWRLTPAELRALDRVSAAAIARIDTF